MVVHDTGRRKSDTNTIVKGARIDFAHLVRRYFININISLMEALNRTKQ